MATPLDLINKATKELGYTEGQGNLTKYAAAAGHLNGYAWCATFMVALFRSVGIRLPNESAWTPSMAQGFKDDGRWGQTPKVGAVVFYNFIGRISHVGVVVAVAPGYILAIEGNTNAAGSRTGGQVLKKRRNSKIVGYGYPRYTTPKKVYDTSSPVLSLGSTGEKVKDIQRALNKASNHLRVDGQFGPATDAVLRLFQKNRRSTGLKVTGSTDEATWKALRKVAHAR